MNGPDFAAQLDSCRYLYLRDLGEPLENSLRLVVQEADASGASPAAQCEGVVASDYRVIASNEMSRTFELRWHNYVAYSVRNESFAQDGRPDVYSGRLLRTFSNSAFLDYVNSSTFASSDFPGPLTHIGVACLNHVVDVVAVGPPTISILG